MFLTMKENEPRLKELAWELAMLPRPSIHPSFSLLKEWGDFTIDLHAVLFFSDGNDRKIEFVKIYLKNIVSYPIYHMGSLLFLNNMNRY